MGSLAVILFAFMAIVSSEMTKDPNPDRAIEEITGERFVDFKSQKSVTVIYFYKQDLPRLMNFLVEYEKSARLIQVYGVKFGMVDCNKDNTIDYCEKAETENYVYIFRSGMELLNLALETMFDVNSIVSNVLQIVLLREVPILQTQAELQKFEAENKRVSDCIFSYQKAIGTYEHRILMELAYAYHGKYKFALTTEEKTAELFPAFDEKEHSAIWVLKCKKASHNEKCYAMKYLDKMDLASLARYVRVLELSPTHDIAKDGQYNPFEPNDLHSVFVYYDRESKDQVLEETAKLADKYHGILGIMLVDVEAVDATQYGFKSSWKVPALAVKLRYEEELHMMQPYVDTPDAFLERMIFKTDVDVEHPDAARDNFEDESILNHLEEDEDISLLEKQDDPVAEAVSRLKKKPIDQTHIPALTDKTFPTMTKNTDFLMVLFYLTFDSRSMAFFHAYSEASKQLALQGLHPLAAVDCFDWTDVCGDNNITSYPVVRIYRKGRPPQEYQGMLSTKAIVSSVKLYMADAPVLLTSSDEGSKFIDGDLPGDIGMITQTSVLGLHTSFNKKEIARFKEMAGMAHGKFLFGLAVDEVAKQLSSRFNAKPPTIIVLKRNDPIQPFNVVSTDMTNSHLMQAIAEASLPVFPELTAVNFPSYFAKKQPFVLYFTTDPKSDGHKTLGNLASSGDFTALTFCWMKLDSEDSLPNKVLSSYISQTPEEALVLVNHQMGTIHVFEQQNIEHQTVTNWLTDVLNGNLEPYKMLIEGDWKPKQKSYNFLKFMDRDRSGGDKTDKSEIDVANEHGIGFNSNGEQHGEMLGRVYTNEEVLLNPADDPENEIRAELHSLRHSRLYHTSEARARHKPHGSEGPHPTEEGYNLNNMEDHTPRMEADNSKPNHIAKSHTEL